MDLRYLVKVMSQSTVHNWLENLIDLTDLNQRWFFTNEPLLLALVLYILAILLLVVFIYLNRKWLCFLSVVVLNHLNGYFVASVELS